MSRRTQALALGAIIVVGLLRGGWWVATTEVTSPVDEIAHADYVAHMGGHGTPPKVGVDRTDNDLLELSKQSATSPWRPSPLTADNRDPKWGSYNQSYEGVQPPLYYAVLALPWKLFHGYGALATLYILRSITLLLAITTIPLTWLLARELFPDRPEVALAAAATLVCIGGFNGNVASLTNDALVMPLATATLWWTARTWNRGYRAREALVAGVLVGATVLAKTTGLVVVPLVALGALGPLWTRGAVLRRYVGWGAEAGGAAAVVIAPWLLWNHATYHAWSASSAVDKITGPLQPPIPRTLHGVVLHLKSAVTAFWSPQLDVTRIGRGAVVMTLAGAAILGAGALFHLRRRKPTRDALAIAWMASAVPLGLLTMIGIIAYVFGGSSSVVGRHLYPTLPALVVAIVAAASTTAGRRVGIVLVAAFVAVGLTFERADDNRYLLGTYTRGVVAGLTPVVGTTRGDGAIQGPRSLQLAAPCRIGGVGIEFADAAVEITVHQGNAVAQAGPRLTRSDAGGGVFAYYAVNALTKTITVDVPATARLSVTEAHGEVIPVAQAYCDRPDAPRRRFATLFYPQHPDWPFSATKAWPEAWVLAGWVMCAAAIAWATRVRWSDAPGGPEHRSASPAASGQDAASVADSPLL